MRADPKPDHIVAFPDARCPVILGNPYGVDWLGRVDLLEAQAGMIRVLDKPPVGFPRSIFNGLRQTSESLAPDRVVFEKLVQILVFGCAYWRIADGECSASTLRRRRDEWIEAGVMHALEQIVKETYDRTIGLEFSDIAVDCCITKAHFWVTFSNVIITVGRHVRKAWTRYRWEGRPCRRP